MQDFIDNKNVFSTYLDSTTHCPLIVTIDCGHGGMVKGEYQTHGKMWDFTDFKFYEGVFNRQIGKALAQKFWSNNIPYTFTTISNYDESLHNRMESFGKFVGAHKTHKHLLLSLHANASSNTEAKGVEWYTSPGITDSDYAANYFFPHLYDIGFRVRVNVAKEGEYDHESNFYVIRKAESFGAMGILMEAGFFTNREEALKMMEQEWQLTYVNTLYKGTRDLIEKIKKDGSVR